MTRRVFEWARVEYQPDLDRPAAPVPLGVIVVGRFPHEQSAGAVILGREPIRSNPPDEFRNVGPLGLAQVMGWVTAIAQDITIALREQQDPFAFVASRWRWNLFVRDPEKYESSAKHVVLLRIAERVYKQAVGEPFKHTPVVKPPPTRWRNPRHRRIWLPAEAGYTIPLQEATPVG